MFGAERYIQQNFKNAWYSEILYLQSVVSGANAVVSIDHRDSGAKMILCSSIWISDALFAITVFTDVYGKILFTSTSLAGIASLNGGWEFWYIINSGQLFISANSANTIFSIGYQYLRETDVKAN